MRTRSMRKIVTVSIPVVLLMLLTGQAGYAQEKWEYILLPYMSLAGVSGDAAVNGMDAEVDASFSDILDVLDLSFSLHGEARKGDWALMIDPAYLKLSEDAEAGPLNMRYEMQQWNVDLAGLYRPYTRELAENRVLTLEALFGARYTSVDQKLEFVGLGGGSETKQWFDPILGGRLMADFTKKLAFSLRADVGGFGISSDLTWNVTGMLGYKFTPLLSCWGGYKALGIDYSTGSGIDRFTYNTVSHGPLVGLGFSF